MADITLQTGMNLRSEDAKSAEFWEAGADLSRGFVGKPQDKAEDDTLAIQMKDPDTKFDNPIMGPRARRIADELENAGVPVSRHLKK